jgi:hypothetical protein
VIEPKSRGVLDHPLSRVMTSGVIYSMQMQQMRRVEAERGNRNARHRQYT